MQEETQRTPPSRNLPLSKVLWTALTGAVTVIALLIGSWMSDVNRHQEQLEQRQTIQEAHYASIQEDLQLLRLEVGDLHRMLTAELEREAKR